MNKQNLHKIITDLIEVRGERDLRISDEVLFEQACTFAREESMNQSQQLKVEVSESEKIVRGTPRADMPIPATKNQLDFIYKNNISVDTKNLTKHEAYLIIKEFKK
jgi:hypothetical protein